MAANQRFSGDSGAGDGPATAARRRGYCAAAAARRRGDSPAVAAWRRGDYAAATARRRLGLQ
ncbi:hypothetical protein LINPERHAP1_LOCUS9439 [Linum perenne]